MGRSSPDTFLANALRIAAFLAVLGLVSGFAAFSSRVAHYPDPDPAAGADAVVVLTGGEGRLGAAIELLQNGAGARLLISGVHPDVGENQLRALSGTGEALFDCCVDLGRTASDTAGNAAEAAQWARSNGYESLIVVTSDYHLPRSLAELSAAMPEVELIAYPVRSAPPWRDISMLRLWTLEYLKYAAVMARRSIIR